MALKVIKLLSALFLILANVTALPHPGKVEARITNGHDADDTEFKFMARIVMNVGNFVGLCGGAVVTDNTVITAAHCVRSRQIAQLEVWTRGKGGQWDAQPSDTQKLRVKQVVIHPRHEIDNKVNPDRDLAILLLDRTIESSKFSPVPLSDKTNLWHGYPVMTAGWGLHDPNGSNKERHLKVLSTEIIGWSQCNGTQMWDGLITDGMFCAGSPLGGYSTCKGDDGGPVLDPSTGRLIGIISWQAQNCGRADRPPVFAHAGAEHAWIVRTVRTLGGGNPW